ncbi:hypothetical protein I7I50_08666 [Histoplasma capsulatum G186AR]|nr:hypothetical protein I7I50_08666 [Histoplasma capsulatum G186AR]
MSASKHFMAVFSTPCIVIRFLFLFPLIFMYFLSLQVFCLLKPAFTPGLILWCPVVRYLGVTSIELGQ